ncbi:uncharacterized protein LOC134846489 [Symsagittifera roscoffensis]|uniref:uncharacterized protein LOC134846489 n=1 Tax=Symsagittifera roscoffensis TaxID=84072 RepID=UPI00307C7120
MVQFPATKICSILLRKLKLKKNVLLLSVILVHLLPACYLLHVFRRRTVAERVEDVQFAIRKSSLLEYLESTKVQLPQEGDKILWLHIPRTTADSTQTTLIGDENDRLIDYSTWESKVYAPFNPSLYLQLQLGKSSHKNCSVKSVVCDWKEGWVRVVKGFFGFQLIEQYLEQFDPQKTSTKVFTIIRHPCERIGSLFKFLTNDGDYSLKTCNRLATFGLPTDCNITLTKFLSAKDHRLRMLTRNYMTWQLASAVNLKGSFSQKILSSLNFIM